MSTAERMERERLAKRALILNTARELFVERGIEAVTLREIAQRIEYSTTAIYVQFKDKQDLVDHMVREDFHAFSSALAATSKYADPVERLHRMGHAYVEFALTMPQHYRLLFMTPNKPGAGPQRTSHDAPIEGVDGYDFLVETVGACMAAGRFRPEHTDVAVIAQAMWAGVHGLVSLLIVMGEVPYFQWRPVPELAELVFGSQLRGLLRDPSVLDRKKKPARRKQR